MHSAVGPETEAELLYFSPSKRILTSPQPKVVWDVGMGTGANVIAAIKKLEARHLNQIEFVSFENDLDGLKTALKEQLPVTRGYESALSTLLNHGFFEHPELGYKWRLLDQDFLSILESEKKLPHAHLVYFDFYSPKSCPALWSVEVFVSLKKYCHSEALFITYSSSTKVRYALLKAGFFVGKGATTTMKAETTHAALTLSTLESPLDSQWLSRKDFANEFEGNTQFL